MTKALAEYTEVKGETKTYVFSSFTMTWNSDTEKHKPL